MSGDSVGWILSFVTDVGCDRKQFLWSSSALLGFEGPRLGVNLNYLIGISDLTRAI